MDTQDPRPAAPMEEPAEAAEQEQEQEQDPDLAAMWTRFQHLTDKLSASNERSDALKSELQQKRAAHTPLTFANLELNELVPDSAAGAEQVDGVLASASDLESSNAVLPALLSLDVLFEVRAPPAPPAPPGPPARAHPRGRCCRSASGRTRR